jgi:hypothetical protein
LSSTLVSAFIPNVNKLDRFNEYLSNGEHFLSIPVNKVVFIDKSLATYFVKFNSKYNHFIYITKDELTWIHEKDNCCEFSDKSDKDTWGYMITMLNKTEWINSAIKNNPFKSDQFIWIDFGIKHIYSGDLGQSIVNMSKKTYNGVRIGQINNVKMYKDWSFNKQLNEVIWVFAGGVFGGSSVKLQQFSKFVKELVEYLIKKHKIITWDVNIWFLIYKNYPRLFECYLCNHDNTLLDNY